MGQAAPGLIILRKGSKPMGEKTGILWCHHTFNSWWGCQKLNQECANCYAATWANRMGFSNLWGPKKTSERRFFEDHHWNEPLTWNRKAEKAGERRRVFLGSMMDIFEDFPGLNEQRERVYKLIESTPWLDWMLLTKRIENGFHMFPERWLFNLPRNVWMGITAGTQKSFDESWPILQSLTHAYPFQVIYISAEPLLEKVDYSEAFDDDNIGDEDASYFLRPVDWIIAGGESGAKARPCHPDWVRSIREQCKETETKFMFKQWGEWLPRSQVDSTMQGDLAMANVFGKDFQYHHWQDGSDSIRVGKEKAGRKIDDRTWEEIPGG